MKFENSWVIAGVRGTSLAIQWDNITIYQSQGFGGFAKYRPDNVNSQTIDLSKCSSFNVKSHNTKNLFPQNTNRYCLSGNNDTILNFTKKDLIYLNELIEQNKADEKILQEKNIIAPQQIQEDNTFCPRTTDNSPQKTTFWPNVTDLNEMCQERNVVAVATLTPKSGKIVYRVGNEAKEIKIDIKQNNSNPQQYYGKLDLDDLNSDLKEVLQDSIIQALSGNPFAFANIGPIMQISPSTMTNPKKYVYYSNGNLCKSLPETNCYIYKNIQTQWATSIQFWWSEWNAYFAKNVTLIFKQ